MSPEKQCNKCGAKGLRWMWIGNHWALVDLEGMPHRCVTQSPPRQQYQRVSWVKGH